MSEQPLSESASARFMWAVAVAEPITAKEAKGVLGVSEDVAQDALLRLWRSGLVERKQKKTGWGHPPYMCRVKRPHE